MVAGCFGLGYFGLGRLGHGHFGQGRFGHGHFGQGHFGQGRFGNGRLGQMYQLNKLRHIFTVYRLTTVCASLNLHSTILFRGSYNSICL